jgi:tryptophanyl-tRNA synthetase
MKGGIGDVKCKKFLEKILNEELGPVRARRQEYEKDPAAVYEILRKGSESAREYAARTLDEVKKAMRIDYFNDPDLIAGK